MPVDSNTLHAYDAYHDNLRVWAFMDLSFKGGAKYKDGYDSEGSLIFQKHKKESTEDAAARKRRASVYNYCRFFSDRFAGYLTKKSPARKPGSDDKDWDEFLCDCTMSGKSFAEVMETLQMRSLRISPYWIRLDVPAGPKDELGNPIELNADERRDLGIRPYVTLVDPRNVTDYEINPQGRLTRIVVRDEVRVKQSALEEESHLVTFTEWTEGFWVRYLKDSRTDIAESSPYTPVTVVMLDFGENPWGFVPYEPLHFGDEEDEENPMFSPSMIHDVANFQRDTFRLGSLLEEELTARTFTTTVVFGVRGDEVQRQLNRMLITIGDSSGSIAKIGSDTKQTDSLLESLHFLQRNTFRTAQFEASGDAKETRTAESGEKRRRDLEGLYQVLAKHSKATEAAENRVNRKWAVMAGKAKPEDFATSSYPRDFDVQTIDEDLDQLAMMIETDFPLTFLNDMRRGIMQKVRPRMGARMTAQIEEELAEIEDEPEPEPEPQVSAPPEAAA
jgi:hypothetical protein